MDMKIVFVDVAMLNAGVISTASGDTAPNPLA